MYHITQCVVHICVPSKSVTADTLFKMSVVLVLFGLDLVLIKLFIRKPSKRFENCFKFHVFGRNLSKQNCHKIWFELLVNS